MKLKRSHRDQIPTRDPGASISGMSVPDAACTIDPLTRELARERLDDLMAIDALVIGEPWNSVQWLHDLPGKWELSRVAMSGTVIAGFLVASRKGDAIHCHRIAVAADVNRRGVGTALMKNVAAHGIAHGATTFTVKAHQTNARSLSFLQHTGFAIVGRDGHNVLLGAPLSTIAARAIA